MCRIQCWWNGARRWNLDHRFVLPTTLNLRSERRKNASFGTLSLTFAFLPSAFTPISFRSRVLIDFLQSEGTKELLGEVSLPRVKREELLTMISVRYLCLVFIYPAFFADSLDKNERKLILPSSPYNLLRWWKSCSVSLSSGRGDKSEESVADRSLLDAFVFLSFLTPCNNDDNCEWEDDPTRYMSTRRWYPTLETLEDGSAIIVSLSFCLSSREGNVEPPLGEYSC